MTTPELISYIKKQIGNNISKDLIISKLTQAGWHRGDVDEAFSIIEPESKPIIPVVEVKKEIPLSLAPEIKKEELIPTLMPKVVVDSFGSTVKDDQPKTETPIIKTQTEIPKSSLIKNLPKSAMLSSYEKDLLSASNTKTEDPRKKLNVMKFLIAILVVSAIASTIWAFTSGYIDVRGINIPFIKKDPKILLLNNSKVLASLKSYKTETNIEISSPSFANISAGLISGEAVISQDKDSISVNTLGVIGQSGSDTLSDNFVTIKSSLLQNYITTDIKNNGSYLFASVPDLSQILGSNAPEARVIKLKDDQVNLILPLFLTKVESQLGKINIYKILSSGMPSYINGKTLDIYNELVNEVEVIEKGQEQIKGVDTYHYLVNADRQSAKKLLSEIANNFTRDLSAGDQEKLAQILGAITINSFDVWVGKGDNNIYQYSVALDVPLSKIVGFEDKSIGDNKVTVNWKTTYYDFDIPNNITMPDEFTSVEDFVKEIKIMKLKNEISSFSKVATSLFTAEGKYGSKPNSNGSCMSPASGSLFSPTGHTKGSVTAVSGISELLNKVLGETNGAGFCYSTSKAWSLIIPIADDYTLIPGSTPEYKSYFCVDNTGTAKDLIAPPTDVVCQ